MVCSPPVSSVHGIIQARILEWVGLPFPSLGYLPNPGIKPASPALQADSVLSEPPGRLIQPVAAAAIKFNIKITSFINDDIFD